ncbi:hypothetical protein [Aeromicrobium sp.]|uniref:hypothetical protein n=1 Tax=Aeromicrobium sp. TaxID=1871063 RepID=UPI002FCC7C72
MTKSARALLILGSILLLLGVLAGVGNREVLDGNRFAQHVDAIRTDPAVSRQVGIVITDKLTRTEPDLVVARPLLESTTAALVGSPAFGPVIRTMVAPVHDVFTDDGDHLVLRLADVGAVLVAAIKTVAPEAAESLPADLDVTLATVGGQGFSGQIIGAAHLTRVLSWLLPLLAILCFAGALLLTKDRVRGLRAVGVAVATSGLVLAAATFIVGVLASRIETDALVPALGVAGWNTLSPALWIAGAWVAAAGYVLVVGSVLRLGVDPRDYLKAVVTWLRTPPVTRPQRAAHGAALLGVGGAAVLRPMTAAAAVLVFAGFMLAVQGLIELAGAMRRPDQVGAAFFPRLLARPELRTAAVAAAGFALVAGLVAWNARPPAPAVAAIGVTPSSQCNGHAELCDRRYNQVAFPATHNSMSAADEPGWYLAEQPTGIIGQLDDGIRVLLFDTWPGQKTQRAGVIANAESSRAEAVKQAQQIYGPSVLSSALRLRESTSLTPVGPVEPYLCHALCELGSTPLEPVMADVKVWMDAHPREVVTFFIQDELDPAVTAKVFDDAGLTPLLYTPGKSKKFPTLREMADSGHRLVVLAENKGGGTTYPWLLQGFDWVQDTPYDALKTADFSCDLLRGTAAAPLLLVNHWLNRPQHRVSDAEKVNAVSVLGPRLQECVDERRHIPNFVAVDYYDRGALFSEVDRLNGVS